MKQFSCHVLKRELLHANEIFKAMKKGLTSPGGSSYTTCKVRNKTQEWFKHWNRQLNDVSQFLKILRSTLEAFLRRIATNLAKTRGSIMAHDFGELNWWLLLAQRSKPYVSILFTDFPSTRSNLGQWMVHGPWWYMFTKQFWKTSAGHMSHTGPDGCWLDGGVPSIKKSKTERMRVKTRPENNFWWDSFYTGQNACLTNKELQI